MKTKLPVLADALYILVDMGNEINEALEDKKIKPLEYLEIAMPLLRVPRVIAEAEELREELKVWVADSQARIELVDALASRSMIGHDKTQAIITETLLFNHALETYISNLKKIADADEDKMIMVTAQAAARYANHQANPLELIKELYQL